MYFLTSRGKFHHFVHNIFGDRRRKHGQRSGSLMQFTAHKTCGTHTSSALRTMHTQRQRERAQTTTLPETKNKGNERRPRSGCRSGTVKLVDRRAFSPAWRSICSNYTGSTDLEFCTGISENALLVPSNAMTSLVAHVSRKREKYATTPRGRW